jgi:hypothetical protein
MSKNITYLILIIIFSFTIPRLIEYPVLLNIAGVGWCIAGSLLLYNTIDYLMKKFTK